MANSDLPPEACGHTFALASSRVTLENQLTLIEDAIRIPCWTVEPFCFCRVVISMTLQYRPRSLWEDRKWTQRVRLSNFLLLEAVDWWCRSDADFPVDETVARVLYLFSQRCDPLGVPEHGLREFLSGFVSNPIAEYCHTWPKRSERESYELIDTLAEIVRAAVCEWSNGSLIDPAIETVNQQIVDEIVAQQYVIFHHNQTTRRDFGGFYSRG